MTSLNAVRWGLVLLAGVPVWAQEQPSAPAPAVSNPVISVSTNSDPGSNSSDGRMLTPPPVSGQSYPLAFGSEERSNYLRGGVTFNTAYSDNVLAGASATPVSDVSYSIWPTIAIDETTSRLHTVLSYAPGFTFYQRITSRNEADQNLALDVQYRLSPHVTVSARDSLQKSSDVFNQPDEGLAGAVSGSTQGVNNSVIAPLADRLNNTGNAGVTYQFSANGMVGASGTFTNLHYPNPDQVPGLFDAASRGGSGFYSYRVAREHYLGVTYQYQELLSYPTGGTNETQTDSVLAFYSYYPARRLSFSLFGGPQYYNAGLQFTGGTPATVPAQQSWTPAGGASVNWQAQHTSVAASYLHSVSGGGGLIGAVKLDSATASLRQQLTRNVSAGLAGSYANNAVLAGLSDLGGHSFSGSASLGRQVGGHLNLQAGYTRLRQTYAVFLADPVTNREWVSISYQFARPLGR